MNKFDVDTTVDLQGLGRKIRDQKAACKSFFATRQNRIRAVEGRLTAEVERVRTQLDDWVDYQKRLATLQESLEQERQELARAAADMDAKACELDQERLEIDTKRRETQQELEQERARLHTDSREEMAAWQQSLETLKADLEAQTSLRLKIESEREALHEQLAEHLARFARLESDAREAKEELVSARHEEHELRSQLTESRKLLDQRAKQLKALRETAERERGQEQAAANTEELNLVRQERDQLEAKVRGLEADLSKVAKQEDQLGELNDLRRRFEMAVEDVRKLRNANEQLERKVQQASAETPAAEQGSWEQQKQQLLARLSAIDNDQVDPDEIAKLENAVRMTDNVVAQKDQQIADLLSKLQCLQDSLAEAAQEEIQRTNRSHDENLSVEHDKLQKLQEEWREKLRAAEVEIAVQRAENARQRAELDEKARDIEAQLALAKKQVALSASQKEVDPKSRRGWFK